MTQIEKGKIKAKRKITAMDFSGENAAVALVSKDQGGPANSFDVALLVKSLNESDKSKDESDVTSTNASVEKSVEPSGSNKNKEETMPATQVEMIEKSALEKIEKALQDEQAAKAELQKALESQKEALEKAMATLAAHEAAQKEALAKSKAAQITAIVKEEKVSAPLIKAALSLESEDDFTAFVAAVQSMMTTVETSEMFVEKGLNVTEQEAVHESPVTKLLKQQFQSK